MSDGSRPVREARRGDLAAIAAIHEAAFPGFFLTLMGRPFLRAYYGLILHFDRGILLVREGDDGKPAGFVGGFLHPTRFYEAMRGSKRRLLLPIALGILQRPSTLPRVLANVRKVRQGGDAPEEGGETSAELASIAVHPERGGKGHGRALISAFLEAAAERGADYTYLTTDADDNERVRTLYERAGFALDRVFERPDGRRMCVYGMRQRRDGRD